MGRLIYSMMVSLDGFVETADHDIDWVVIDDEIHAFANDQCRVMGAFVYGRGLYETMAEYWPTADQDPDAPPVIVDFARIWKATPKLVFSDSLEEVDHNSRLIRGDVGTEIARLKTEIEGDLGLGGATLAASVVPLGLIDEFRLFINPVVLGSGTPYLPPLARRLELRPLESRRFASGVVYVSYEPARD